MLALSENVLIALLVNIPAILGAVVASIVALRSRKSAAESAVHAEAASFTAQGCLQVAQDVREVVKKRLGDAKQV